MKITKETFEKLKKLDFALLDDRGWELPNPVPLEFETGLKRPLTLQEQIQRVMRVELSKQAQNQGRETFEESQDFAVEDPFESEMLSGYEIMDADIIMEQNDAHSAVRNQPVQPTAENENVTDDIPDDSP